MQNDNKNKNQTSSPWVGDLVKVLEKNLQSIGDRFFETRKELNKEKCKLLSEDIGFQSEISSIKKKLQVPRLDPSNDLELVFVPNNESNSIEFEISSWATGEGKSTLLEKEINRIIRKYELPLNFYDWVRGCILYEKSDHFPLYNVELINQVIENPTEVQRIPLTTREKKFVKWIFRQKTGIKRRPPKAFGQAYKELSKLLSKSKNRKRRLRNLQASIATLERGKIRKELDLSTYKKITRRTTYNDLIPDIFTLKEEENFGPKKLSQRLRKRFQRIKERIKK